MLVECLIGLLLIAVALLGIMMAFTASIDSMTAMREKEGAMLMALGLMNELEGVELTKLRPYVKNLLAPDSHDHYPGYAITNDGVAEMVTWYPSEATPISAEIRIAIRRVGGERGVELTREVSRSGFQNAGVVD